MWVVEIDLISVWGIKLELILVMESALTWFLCVDRKILGFSGFRVCVDRKILGFSVWIEMNLALCRGITIYFILEWEIVLDFISV